MPIAPTTVFFEDYFQSTSSLDNYLQSHYDPTVQVGKADNALSIRREDDEGYLRVLPSTAYCPNNPIGHHNANCKFGKVFYRPEPAAAAADWYHVRSWIRVRGDWWDGEFWEHGTSALAIVMPNKADPDGFDVRAWVVVQIQNFATGGPRPTPLLRTPKTNLGFGILGMLDSPLPPGWDDFQAGSFGDDMGVLPNDEWVCFEIAVGDVDEDRGFGRAKAYINDTLVETVEWDYNYSAAARPGRPIGFMFGDGGGIDGSNFQMHQPEVLLGGILYGSGMMERTLDRPAGLSIDFKRIASGDGPLGCLSRGGAPEEPVPDPDAMRCVSADNYASADEIRGECGRVLCNTTGKTRESWETIANGYPSAKSFWFRWVAPRDGNFIFRTRGSEVFNEVSVHRHTGATPPPRVASSDDDPWDPTASTSAAVEILAEAGVEYRIRVASGLDGWIVLDFGPARHLVQDDGWSIDESERETRTRVSVAGLVSGLAIEDDQVAASPTGAGTSPTMEPVLFEAIGV